jgi:hypothetical protein
LEIDMKSVLSGILALLMLAGAVHAQTQPPLRPLALALDSGTKTASATAGAATLSKAAGVITTEALSTAAAASYTLTLTNTAVAVGDQVLASVALGTATTGTPVITSVKEGAGSVVIIVKNIDASAAFNGTLRIKFAVLKN